MRSLLLLSLISFLFTSPIFTQDSITNWNQKTHLDHLKDAILLVQLPNRNAKITKLKEINQMAAAKKEAAEVDQIRKSVIAGFEQEFDFCQFAFFEREHTQEILEGNFQNVFDANFNKGKSIPQQKVIYVAQYGKGKPKGENANYNGVGIQIKYVFQKHLEAIGSDLFYKKAKRAWIIGKRRAIILGIKTLNKRLIKVHYGNRQP